MELRQVLALDKGTAVAFFFDGDKLMLCRHEKGGVFCDGDEDLLRFLGHDVCRHCSAQWPKRASVAE